MILAQSQASDAFNGGVLKIVHYVREFDFPSRAQFIEDPIRVVRRKPGRVFVPCLLPKAGVFLLIHLLERNIHTRLHRPFP